MNRRDWLKASGGLSASCLFPSLASVPALAANPRAAPGKPRSCACKLRHTWTTTMSSSEYRDTLQAHLTRDGVTGVGEGAPIVRYHENAADRAKRRLQPSLLYCRRPIRGSSRS